MPLYVLTCVDKPKSLALRVATREAHLAYVGAARSHIRAAGPLLDAAGEMSGSLFIMDCPDHAAVAAFSEADPYRVAGLFETVEIRAWRQTVGAPL
jgi:uncharacterized protein YciI